MAAATLFLVCAQHGPGGVGSDPKNLPHNCQDWWSQSRLLVNPDNPEPRPTTPRKGAQPSNASQLLRFRSGRTGHTQVHSSIMQVPALSLGHHVVWLL